MGSQYMLTMMMKILCAFIYIVHGDIKRNLQGFFNLIVSLLDLLYNNSDLHCSSIPLAIIVCILHAKKELSYEKEIKIPLSNLYLYVLI